tara:strand:+ start:3973 stop:4383 length:411 start_codon:yes stop_codon:yes gene_type:complete
MRMKITKKRFKEILAEEIQAHREGIKHERDKNNKAMAKSAEQPAKNKGKLMPEASADDYHDEWEEIDLDNPPPEQPAADPIETVRQKMHDLTDAIEEHGSHYDLVDDYRNLFYAIQEAGVNLEQLIFMVTEGKGEK